MGVLDHISGLLDEIDIKYTHDENVLTMRWRTDHFQDLKIKVVANADESWVYIVAPFTNFYQVDEDDRGKLAVDMLRESWKANGVKFAIDEEDDIIVLAETNDTDITAEEIKILIGHVVNACDTLWKIYPSE
ncbi:hypothetical protein EU537_04230 [Candidatus Thorarchaeota archaeon]|nr:MAG: hypothetical protein EU537_04230 [Candidatus Thorarchaeota archaeon]